MATRRHGWRWLATATKALVLAAVLWAYGLAAWQVASSLSPPVTTYQEKRHMALMTATRNDLRLDFTEGVSRRLNRWLPHRTDGEVQPLWPWLTALVVGGGSQAEAAVHQHGRWLQLGLTTSFLALLGLACARRFTVPSTALVVLLVGFHGLLPLVGPFTSDALFQVLFLLVWAVCIYALLRNSLWAYGLVGALGALAYLADSRVLTLLVLFAGVSTLRAFWQWLCDQCSRGMNPVSLWHPRNHILGMPLAVMLFLFIAGPRMVESHQLFGDALLHQRAHSLDDESRVITDGEPPLAQVSRGLRDVWARFWGRGGFAVTTLALLLLVMVVALPLATPAATHVGQHLHPETVPAVFFMLAGAAVYTALLGWDHALEPEARNPMVILQPPMVLGLLWACESLHGRARRRRAAPAFGLLYQALLWLLLAYESWRVIPLLQAAGSVV